MPISGETLGPVEWFIYCFEGTRLENTFQREYQKPPLLFRKSKIIKFTQCQTKILTIGSLVQNKSDKTNDKPSWLIKISTLRLLKINFKLYLPSKTDIFMFGKNANLRV